ncbi:type II toxin-antitoxin system RelE/ParE family toxin [Halomonas eurihalina]|uniref:Type II toxin-antitoxin system RelE/ParE family toxin n=1 Tax=Halomonas eurihalina TaxID=42566 RepID=A0A5D9CNH6_HALER|nr:type II toxin-antitoxin system RelE/ParE family toxin [Halomonas eurihalina]MDR5858451.1 type II toxin-antitoxin system RelE/ParE family toxin [Halomonas eurihalina]TZG31671.1 type II toxin-antitoxin system RelE/ParE family toxin [Halomonas eurihalina]
MIGSFRDSWLETFFVDGTGHKKIPGTIETALMRKLDIIDAATDIGDLRVPPGNRLEYLEGKLAGKCAIRVNRQYRLIFEWNGEKAHDLYLDPHTYR